MNQALSQEQLAAALLEPQLRRWSEVGGRLQREYQFSSFVEAFSFMTSVALHAEALQHHPEWSNSFSRVSVTLFSHDAQAVTGRDLELARRMEKLAAGRAIQ